MKCKTNKLQRIIMLVVATVFTLNISAQQVTVSGQVTDATGESIIGASVLVKGSTKGAVTDMDGNYVLPGVPQNAELVFSYIGYEGQTIKVAGKKTINVVLQEERTELNEVVVVGYGSMAKKEISSSIVQIDKDKFIQGAASDPMALVAGKIAGLNVASTADADPNTLTSFQVRGATSITADNGPLIVIDGVAGGDLRNLAAQDVESITVLKDAGSAAIYGTRGANGVILVTTKKGQGGEGGTNITYDSYAAVNIAKPHADILSADEFRRSGRGLDYGYNTDWYSEITRKASYNVNQYVSIDHTSKTGYYSASLNYKKSNGLDIASGRQEFGGRFVVEQRALNNHIQINSSLSLRKVHEDWGNDGLFDTALTINPTLPVYNADGTYYQPTSPTDIHNPVNDLKNNVSNGDRVYLLGNADLKWNILQLEHHMLSTSLSYALQYNDLKSNTYVPSTSSESYWEGYAGKASVNYQKWTTNRLEWLGNYTLTLPKHQLKAVVGYSWERNNWEQSGNTNYNFTYDSTSFYAIGSGSYLADGKASMWGGKSESTLIGFFGRLNYNFDDIIYASASFRREGCTKFGKNKKWGNFPSGSLAWETTNTPGLSALKKVFQSLKLRASYGVTGRSDFDAYKSLPTYSTYGGYYMDKQWVVGYAPSSNVNNELQWEKSSAFNIGIDLVALNRIRASIEYFDRRSNDLLYTYTAPQPPFVYDNILVNVGSTKNTGVELSIDGDVFAGKKFSWTTGVVYSYGKTKLTKLSSDIYKASYLDLYQKPGVGTSEYFFRVVEGGEIGQFYGYEYAGTDGNGNMLIYNDKNEKIPVSQADASYKRNIGNGAPRHFLSWNNTLRYGDFDASIQFRGAFGFQIFNMRKYGMGLQGCGTDNVLRSAYLDDKDVRTGGGVISSYFLENGDYFKLDNVTVGWTYRPKNRTMMESLRIYVTAKNLFTITGYTGNDPSIVTSTGITPGVDVTSAYPTATQLSLGVTLKLGTGVPEKKTNVELASKAPEVKYIDKVIEKRVEVPVEKIVEKVVDNTNRYVVSFDMASSNLTEADKTELNKIKAGSTVTIVGYASPDGTIKANKAVSAKRAQVVTEYLKARGVNVVSASGNEADGRIAVVTVK